MRVSSRQSKTLLVRLVMAIAANSPFTVALADDPAGGLLPPIEAKSYALKVVRPSRSGRVYLFQKSDREMPDLGRIFLLREGAQPVMAFRVLKLYPENTQIAAKKVREYPGRESLARGSQFRAYEKIGDILNIPGPTVDDTADLRELENTPPPVESAPLDNPLPVPTPEPSIEPSPEPSLDPATDNGALDLNAETPPSDSIDPGGSPTTVPAAPTEAPAKEAPVDEVDEPVEVDETSFRDEGTTDYFPNWGILEVTGIRNGNIPAARYQRGIGLIYGRNFVNNIFTQSADYPDLLTLDMGFYFYKTNAVDDGIQKSYTLLPLKAQIRYTKPISESLSLYLYGGVLYNYVIGQLNVTQAELNRINVMGPAIGAGALIQFGPNWYIKVNLGLDTVGAGIVLRF